MLMILKLWCAGDISSKVKTFLFILMSLLFLTYLNHAIFIHWSYNTVKQNTFPFGIFLYKTSTFHSDSEQ